MASVEHYGFDIIITDDITGKVRLSESEAKEVAAKIQRLLAPPAPEPRVSSHGSIGGAMVRAMIAAAERERSK